MLQKLAVAVYNHYVRMQHRKLQAGAGAGAGAQQPSHQAPPQAAGAPFQKASPASHLLVRVRCVG